MNHRDGLWAVGTTASGAVPATARTSSPVRGASVAPPTFVQPSDPRGAVADTREAAAERITEDVLQLLFVAQHEIADLEVVEGAGAALAQLRVREAIGALREVVTLLHPDRDGTAVRPTLVATDALAQIGRPPLLPDPPAATAA